MVLEIIQGKTTVAAASRQFDPTPAEIESWVEDGKRGMENALRAKPEDVREQYGRQLKDLHEAYGEAMLEIRARKKAGIPAGKGRELMLSVQQGLADEGVSVPMTKLCRWFGVARRTTHYKPIRSPAKVNAELAEPIFQLKGWQVRKRALGQRPRIEAKVSRAEQPEQRWATDLCRVWGGKDGWLSLALVIDCSTRQLLGWRLARTGRASTASAALEQALITRYGTLGRVPKPFLLRSDNGLVFTSRDYTRLVRSYGLKQEFITLHCPQQNGMVERVIRTLKEQCVHRHRFASQTHALRIIGDWIGFYNQQRPHQALKIMTPDAAYAATLTA